MDYISLCATATVYYSADGLISAVAIPLDPASEADPDPQPTADAVAAAEQFVAWSRGTGPVPRFADEVDLRQGGFKMLSISSVEASDATAWVPCHRLVSNCPLPIPYLVADRGQIRFSAGLPEGNCWPRSQGPQNWRPDVTLTWRIGPCRDWSAVQLDVNDAGQISAANLVPAQR